VDGDPLLAERVLPDVTLVHGEGVVWDSARDRLLFVDIPEGRILDADVTSGEVRSVTVPGTVGAVHPTDEPGALVIADSDGVALVRDGAVERLASPLGDRPDVRMNDANVDPAGRYVAGSMAFGAVPGAAHLWRLDTDGTLHTLLSDLTISNGIDWSADGTRCFFVDSPTERVDVYDYDVATGALSGRRTFADTSAITGVPDGLTLDADGGVWVAFFGGSRVQRFAPDGSPDVTVELPVSKVTSCCFGGPGLTELYISTSTEGLSPEEHAAQPGAGGVFRAVTGHRGRPGTPFAVPKRAGS
jgi:sugar lactone lactonase YvrE